MIRLTALNDDSSRSSIEDDVYPKEPPQEVQEENALKLYNEALKEQKSDNFDKAEELYKELLNTNYLQKIKPDEENIKGKKPENVFSLYSRPDLMLKYSCLKNLAVLSEKKNLINQALSYYSQALEVDGSDVTIWFQMGCAALKLYEIKVALEVFLQGLELSPKHWPSLDNIIMCLYVLRDYVHCLYFISKAFSIDVNYTRGQILRDHILTEQPSIKADIKYYFQDIELHWNKKCEVSEEIKANLLNEVLTIDENYSKKCREEIVFKEKIKLYTPSKIEAVTWVCLGECILSIFEEIMNDQNQYSLDTSVDIKYAVAKDTLSSEGNSDIVNNSKESKDSTMDQAADDKLLKKVSDNNSEKKSKKNKGSALMEELLWGGKRRSARVRSSLRGNPEPMDVAEALRRILPRKLLHKSKQTKIEKSSKGSALEEDSLDTMDLYRLFERQESAEEKRLKEQEKTEVEQDIGIIVDNEGYFGKKNEEEDVKAFADKENEKNIIEIVKSYVMSLKNHWKKTWPITLPYIYIKCFQLMRMHYPMDFTMCTSESKFQTLVEESGSVLLYGELFLEHLAAARNKNSSDSSSLPPLQIIFLQNVMPLTDRKDLFENEEVYFEFLLRLYWLRCRIFLEKGQTSLAIVALNDVLACYDLFPQLQSTVINLKNCRKHNMISKLFTEEFLAHQSRKRSLAEVVRLYEDESYKELTEILKDTFTSTPDAVSNYFREQENELVDRQTQLSMLINGLHHLKEYKESVFWLETGCYEILQKSLAHYSSSEETGESWMVTFDRFLVAMEDCIKLGKLKIIDALPRNRLSRFVQTLCHVICKELEDSDRPPCPARPWILLNTILIELEEREKSETSVNNENENEEADDEDEENDIPSSILILFTAHEYLGRREWCNCNDSVLLFLIMDQVIPQIRNPEWASFRETIQQHLEQVIYCLYSHPNKKSKARYLTDHNVNCVPLTWQRGIQLFDLFRPDETPSYDSLRINLIGSETEVLFRRIAALIPDDKDPVQISSTMTEFIVGKRNDVPATNIILPEPVQDLFYILGDYYFKTHEFAKAVNYLLMDLCANPGRVDSWASMALSRASLLEQQLNSCDPLKDEEFLQSALSALRCYEHCLQLDNKQCALWIEYGSFVYTIHSFCSQRMKLEAFNLSLEQFQELESTKNKMLETAKQAFINANLIWYEVKEENERQDERWLHHYMLGKICEKNGDLNFFDHYEKAAELLYENEAEFPSKVGYTTPQTLAIEALEVYYRVHVCIIKNLELNEGKVLDQKTRQLFIKHLNICSKGPFAKQVSKGDLAKVKARELEITQQEKNLKIVKAVLNDIILKIETESKKEKIEKMPSGPVSEEKNIASESVEALTNNENVTSGVDIEIKETISEDQNKSNNDNSKPEECLNKKIIEDKNTEKLESSIENSEDKNAQKSVTSSHIDFNEPEKIISSPGGLENYERDYKNMPDNYFEPMDDLKETEQTSLRSKKRRRESQGSVSSSSCDSVDLKCDDDSSSSSSSSESSASSQSTSTSSSESSHSQSDDTNKEASKVTDDDEKQSDNEKDKSLEKNSQESSSKSESLNQLENNMLKRCLRAFETCALRFPQHYKSVYRLAHFYFRSKEHRDINKCKDLLLGRYQAAKGMIPGLFSERKNTNFFNGIWRIPAGDVDRPGSFASHMSRSVLLLMEVLRDLKDHKMLLEICFQLRKTPEPDKKYLREDERNQLSMQSCDLAIQTLRKNVKDSTVMTLPIVLDCYRCYQKVQKHYAHKESVYGDILLEAFKRLGKGDKCSLEQALRFCQSEVSTVKTKIPKILSSGLPSTPKSKKQEKKRLTPKPQITARAVPKTPRPKKSLEAKNKPSLNLLPPNILMDPTFWSSIVKPSLDQKMTESMAMNIAGAQLYAEMLRNAAFSVKQREQLEKKITEQTTLKNSVDQLLSEMSQKQQSESAKSPGYYQYHNNLFDLTSEKYKQLMSNYWANLSLSNSVYNQMQSVHKSKRKGSKQQSVLKSNPSQKSELPKPSEDIKSKTNFNIEDILNKPSLTVTKTQSSAATSSLKSIEEKIKSISKEVHITKCSASQVINLSTGRKNVIETGKRSHTSVISDGSTTIKKICRESDQASANKKEKIEVVVIDD